MQSPRHVVSLLRSVHGNEPTRLREDFCGTAAVSRRFAAEAKSAGHDAWAVAIDVDREVVERAAAEAAREGVSDRVRVLRGDCLDEPPVGRERADVIFVGNFSVCYIYDRGALVEYFRQSLARLKAGGSGGGGGFGGGIFACDVYGGASAMRLGSVERRHPSPGKEIVRYLWEHEAADPRTGRVRNSISFRVEVDGEIVQELPRAFVYEWRLWSLPELRDAMLEGGFAGVEVYSDVNVAPGQRASVVEDPKELGEDWIVLVVGRA